MVWEGSSYQPGEGEGQGPPLTLGVSTCCADRKMPHGNRPSAEHLGTLQDHAAQVPPGTPSPCRQRSGSCCRFTQSYGRSVGQHVTGGSAGSVPGMTVLCTFTHAHPETFNSCDTRFQEMVSFKPENQQLKEQKQNTFKKVTSNAQCWAQIAGLNFCKT